MEGDLAEGGEGSPEEVICPVAGFCGVGDFIVAVSRSVVCSALSVVVVLGAVVSDAIVVVLVALVTKGSDVFAVFVDRVFFEPACGGADDVPPDSFFKWHFIIQE